MALAVTLAPATARADQPRLRLRMEYTRSADAKACPAGASALRGKVLQSMGYDPFDQENTKRDTTQDTGSGNPGETMSVALETRGGGYVAKIERFNAAGERTWSEVFPPGQGYHPCATLIERLAPEIVALLLITEPEPKASIPPQGSGLSASPLLGAPMAAAPPLLPIQIQQVQHVQAPPASLTPSLPSPLPSPLPNHVPSHLISQRSNRVALGIAVGGYALSLLFLGLGIGYTVDAQRQKDATFALQGEALRLSGDGSCAQVGDAATDAACSSLLSRAQAWDRARTFQNLFYALSGVTAAVGLAATLVSPWATASRTEVRGSLRVSVSADTVAVRGTF